MAYDGANLSGPLQMGGGTGKNFWGYDTADNDATVVAADYVSDAKTRGMAKGDIVMVTKWDTVNTGTPADVGVFCVSEIDADGNGTLIAAVATS